LLLIGEGKLDHRDMLLGGETRLARSIADQGQGTRRRGASR
jgi:hypothetical protein